MIQPIQNADALTASVNPNQLQPTAINPGAFSNVGAIQSMYGAQVPNTFTRSVGANDPYAAQAQQQVQIAQDQNALNNNNIY